MKEMTGEIIKRKIIKYKLFESYSYVNSWIHGPIINSKLFIGSINLKFLEREICKEYSSIQDFFAMFNNECIEGSYDCDTQESNVRFKEDFAKKVVENTLNSVTYEIVEKYMNGEIKDTKKIYEKIYNASNDDDTDSGDDKLEAACKNKISNLENYKKSFEGNATEFLEEIKDIIKNLELVGFTSYIV